MPVAIPALTKATLNTALESASIVIAEDVVQAAATTAVAVSVFSAAGDTAATVLADLSAAVKAEVVAKTGISADDLVVVKAEVVVGEEPAAPTAAPVAAAPAAAPTPKLIDSAGRTSAFGAIAAGVAAQLVLNFVF